MSKEYIYNEDALYIANSNFVEWNFLDNSTVLVTGATGLIGSTLIRGLLKRNELYESKIKLIALIRNKEKYERIFRENINYISPVYGDITDFELENSDIDYIVHSASITASKEFVNNPVGTILTSINGTKHVLDAAVKCKAKRFIYLSSMEVYGQVEADKVLTENIMGNLNPISVRNSYPESKRMCENLCISYMSQYKIPVNIIRLTQSFGPGVEQNDMRVFAEFARCIIENKDITLLSEGNTKRMYLYTADAATAILTVLTKGEPGQVYNAANEDTYCSIKEMADMVVCEFGLPERKVVINALGYNDRGFNFEQTSNMNVEKLRALGWMPNFSLAEMYRRMMKNME